MKKTKNGFYAIVPLQFLFVNEMRHCWLQKPPKFIQEGKKYLIILPEKDGDHGYWKHIALINTPVSALNNTVVSAVINTLVRDLIKCEN